MGRPFLRLVVVGGCLLALSGVPAQIASAAADPDPAAVGKAALPALPEIADGGKTYTFHLRKGVYFTPDAAFKSEKRELVAEDVAYSIKRFLDPKNRSPWRFLFDGKIIGLNEQEALAKKNGDRFQKDAEAGRGEVEAGEEEQERLTPTRPINYR